MVLCLSVWLSQERSYSEPGSWTHRRRNLHDADTAKARWFHSRGENGTTGPGGGGHHPIHPVRRPLAIIVSKRIMVRMRPDFMPAG